jgi:hypothetical protein
LLIASLTQDALFDLLDRLREQGSALVSVSRRDPLSIPERDSPYA